MQRCRAGGQLRPQPLDLCPQVLLGAQRGGAGAGSEGIVEHRAPEHAALHGPGHHRVDPPEVLPLLRDLRRDATEELQVCLVRTLRGVLPAGADEVGDVDRAGLAEAVDAADALLEPVRVERDVVVDDAAAVGLQVDALAGAVGG